MYLPSHPYTFNSSNVLLYTRQQLQIQSITLYKIYDFTHLEMNDGVSIPSRKVL